MALAAEAENSWKSSGGLLNKSPKKLPKYELKPQPQPQTYNPANPYPAQQYQRFEKALADMYARYTLWMLIIVGIPFLIGLICLIDILRNEFTGNNKVVWL